MEDSTTYGGLKQDAPSVQPPSICRMVVFVPNNEWIERNKLFINGATEFAAIVSQTFGGLSANLHVLLLDDDLPVKVAYSVPHESERHNQSSYWWKWPDRK